MSKKNILKKNSLDQLLKRGSIWHATSLHSKELHSKDTHAKSNYHSTRNEQNTRDSESTANPFPLSIPLGIKEIDNTLPAKGFSMGSVHEWTHHDPDIVRNKATHWYVPTTILSTLASNALTSSISGATNKRFAIWIGKRVWPTPSILALTMNRSVSKESLAQKLERCFFIDLPSERMRLWTICTALRCPSVAVVIADISKLPFPAMRQVTLSAKKGRTLALLTRAPWQNTVPLSGQMRWTVRPLRSDSTNSRWELALTRCKGVQATRPLPIKWTVEFSHEAEDEEVRLHIPADSSYTDTSYTETSHTKTNCADTTATQQPTTVHAVA